ncbi:hypothetical protein OPW12_12820, partial [Vibrio europaeus]|uniref:hypothetical protein n=1 Tax=Vibrio europaeus TaxID=300876 RepID=UPI00233EE4DA
MVHIAKIGTCQDPSEGVTFLFGDYFQDTFSNPVAVVYSYTLKLFLPRGIFDLKFYSWHFSLKVPTRSDPMHNHSKQTPTYTDNLDSLNAILAK